MALFSSLLVNPFIQFNHKFLLRRGTAQNAYETPSVYMINIGKLKSAKNIQMRNSVQHPIVFNSGAILTQNNANCRPVIVIIFQLLTVNVDI